jgi:hypothetical protein
VVVRDGAVRAEENHAALPSVPTGIALPRQWGAPHVVRRGRAGLLFGFDHGEWGGALLWYADDGTFKQKLLDDNVVEVVPVAGGFTVFAGLSHLGSDTGRATAVVDAKGAYSLGRSAELGSAPRAVVVEDTGALLIATMTGIVRLGRDFQVQPLHRASWGMFYPVSLALLEGTAYVGMRGIVAEVQLGADPVTETWLAPVDLK